MEGANLPVEDRTETVATSTEVKTFDRMEGASIPVEDQIETVAPSREGKTSVTGMEAVNLPIGDQIEPVAPSRERKTSVTGMEAVNLPIGDQIEPVPTSEMKTFDMGIEGANFPTEDRMKLDPTIREARTFVRGIQAVNLPIGDQIEPVATSEMKTFDRGIEGANFPTEDLMMLATIIREARTFVRGIQGVNFQTENQRELVAPSSEAKSLDMGVEGSNFTIKNRIEPIAPSRQTETLVWGTEGANYPIEHRIDPIAPSRETETWMERSKIPIEDPIVPVATSSEAKTLVLFGRVGNGKSALGNSIFGKKEFVSKISASGVTTTCKLGTTSLDDGQVVNVIDTPGLFDLSKGSDRPDYLANEMVKCITLAEDGIHGFILVCSIKTRFSIEEEGVIQSLGKIFGEKIFDYLVVVFTGGDELEMTFQEFLSTCPSSLKTVLQLCKRRSLLFDNRTKDENQRKKQVQQLMKCIGQIRDENGQPYKSETFERMKKEALGKHEANTSMMCKQVQHPTRTVYGAENSKNHSAQQKSSDWGNGNETSREKVLKKELIKAKKSGQYRKEVPRENEKLKRNQQDRGGNIGDYVRDLCTIM
ncbi:uncharacterized protein LOC113329903 isoform X2 [Papaver somniferum]|nr:uncharacterized protein LOC113329903 isoform X2 [Papaver somniferum]XP_026432522.1 uncharacterized protein LOC113329903 isoform X2 [Papaver somniferum]